MAAALVAMVARLTIGREKFADVEGRMMEIASQAERLRTWFQEAVVLDEQAFLGLMKARKLPKGNEVEKETRARAIELATREAASIPLQVVEKAVRVIHLAKEVAENGNPNAITDASSAALISQTAIQVAGLNIKINAAMASDKLASEEWIRTYTLCSEEADAVYEQIKSVLNTRSGIQI